MRTHRMTWLAALVLVVAACTPSTGPDDEASPGHDATDSPPDAPTTGSTPSDSTAAGGTGDCTPVTDLPGGAVQRPDPTRAPFPWDRQNPPVVDGFDASEIILGGPPPDGILPIDDPCFDDTDTADEWLSDDSPVMVLEHRGDVRAYPLAIMTQHEIVNDVVGEDPVVVTYCPLCNSGLAFRSTVDGEVLDFGTSGRLYLSNLVMYDRQSRSLWTQFDGRAVVGSDHVGTTLERLPTSLLGWADLLEAAPDALVLSPQTMPTRDYGRNPYPGYEDNAADFLFRGPTDDRIGPNTRVVGLADDQADDTPPVAVTLPHLRDTPVVDVDLGDTPVTVWWTPGQASALDAVVVDEGDDVGSTAAFDRRLDDGSLVEMTAGDDGTFVDEVTGSRFNLLGEAIDGPLEGTTLEPVAHDDTFWFVWFAFQPETTTIPDVST